MVASRWSLAVGATLAVSVAGCAAAPQCVTGMALGASPEAATADSSQASPANQQQFQVGSRVVLLQQGSGVCGIPQVVALVHPQWTNPDPAHVTISSADDATNGLATCTGPTAGAVTLTATLSSTGTTTAPIPASVQLTCK